MNILAQLWRDECGAILSAEAVMIGTVGVIGATVGLSTVATAVNAELQEVGMAIRSFDQSYSVQGHSSCRASTAGSRFVQQDVAVSLEELRADAEREERELRERFERREQVEREEGRRRMREREREREESMRRNREREQRERGRGEQPRGREREERNRA